MRELNPDDKRFRSLDALKLGLKKNVILLEEMASGALLVGHVIASGTQRDLLGRAARLDVLARNLATFKHPNLPLFHSQLNTSNGTWFLFHFADGYPLSQYQSPTPAIPLQWAMWWFREGLEALNGLSGVSMTVGGMDPSDFVVLGSRLMLTDLGLMEALDPEGAALARPPGRLPFMPPEARHSTVPDPAADVYSMAAVAYWMVLGRPPEMSGTTNPAELAAVLLRHRPDCPPELAELLGDMLQYQPGHREKSASRALDRLALHMQDLSQAYPPPPPLAYTLPVLAAVSRRQTVAVPVPVPVLSARTEVNPFSPPTVQVDYPQDSLQPPPPPRTRWLVPALVLAGVLTAAIVTLSSPRKASAQPAFMTVESGRIDQHRVGQGGEWENVTALVLPLTDMVASRLQSDTVLSFGRQSFASLEPRTIFRLVSGTDHTLELALLQGSMRLRLDPQEIVTLDIPRQHLVVAAGSRADIVVAPSRFLSMGAHVQVEAGGIRLEDIPVSPGRAYRTSGGRAPWAEASALPFH